MTEWKAKRFWKAADVLREGDGWTVALDGRPVRTPGKQPLILPTEALARAIAAEWDAQDGAIDPYSMPMTRAANSTVEKVRPQREAVATMLAEYGGTDLLCYRADAPEDLARRQAAGWDPLIDWAAVSLQAPLRITEGIVPVQQDNLALAALAGHIAAHDDFALTALHDLVTIPGSLVLGLAVTQGRIDAAQAFELSRLDEEFQAEQWGRDAESDEAAEGRRLALTNAERFLQLSRAGRDH